LNRDAARIGMVCGKRYADSVTDTLEREPGPVVPDPYLVAWSDLRSRRRWAGTGLAFFALALLLPTVWHGNGTPIMITTGLALFALASRCELFRCPRCARRFCRRGIIHNTFAYRCLHCGIKADAPKA
jgi:hypothetical protein